MGKLGEQGGDGCVGEFVGDLWCSWGATGSVSFEWELRLKSDKASYFSKMLCWRCNVSKQTRSALGGAEASIEGIAPIS